MEALKAGLEALPYACAMPCAGFCKKPNDSQKPPKVVKTTNGKVFPMIHSIMPAMIMQIPPSDQYGPI